MAESHFARELLHRLESRGSGPAFRFQEGGEWKTWDWDRVREGIESVARSLVALGVPELASVALFSPNRPEWTLCDVGALAARCVPVPIYPTNTVKQAAYILADADARVCFAGGAEQYEKALAAAEGLPGLKRIVVFDPSVPLRDDGRSLSFAQFLKLGEAPGAREEARARLDRGAPEDLLTIIYTSGTTGEPKGVMLTHSNILACFEAHERRLPPTGPGDVSLCFLPLSHVFERCWTYYNLHRGVENAYLEDPKQVAAALPAVRPTVMCAVPRFYEKVYGAVMTKVQAAPLPRRALFRWALRTGAEAAERRRVGAGLGPWLGLRHRLADGLVLKKLRALTGGRVRYFPCAGAPLAPEIERFFDAAGMFVAYGYGLTETTATVSVHEWTGFEYGTVGKPLPGVEVRIGEGGEIQVRGATVMKGYYNKPEETAEAFVDGWFRTGDAGEIDAGGRIAVTDRIKDLIKTSGGKYVAPQAVEMALLGDPLVEQVAVIGERRKYITALIVPNFPALEEWARDRGVEFSDRDSLLCHPEVKAVYERRIRRRSHDLAPYEQIKRFALLPKEFSQEAGELTPTMKVKRKEVAEKYADLIETLYREA
ncbi:MAG: AMP-dependent synthetase/ligase [Acidobacteriota bacterium]